MRVGASMRSNVVGGLLVGVFAIVALWDTLHWNSRPHLFWLVTGIALLGAAVYFGLLWASISAAGYVVWSAFDLRRQWRRRWPR
jgi:hypothetical protein